MRKYALLAAGAILAVGVSSAQADFVLTNSRTTQTSTGLDVVDFYARNDGANATGKNALASDITLSDASGHNLVIKLAGAKADVTGASMFAAAGSDPTVFYDSKPDRSFVNLLGDVSSTSDTDPTAYSVVATVPSNSGSASDKAAWQAGVSSFELTGANLNGGVDATSASNGGHGALIAVAVVQHNDTVTISGQIAGEGSGPVTVFTPSTQGATSAIPEPASIGLIGLALAGLGLRRRRA